MKKGRIPVKDKWQKHLLFDVTDGVEQKRQVFSFIAMAVTAIVVFIGLILSNYLIYPLLLTTTLVFALTGMSIALLLYFKTKDLAKTTLISSVVIIILVVFLTYTGGKENTALYWLMFSPLAAYAIFGIYWGSLLTLTLIISIIGLLYGPDIGQAVYGSIEKSRFIASYSVVILFAFINEFFRNQSFETISTITLEQRNQANSDPLTGLANRRFIDSQLLPQIKNDHASFFPLSIIMADIDSFKIINDDFGHDIGDQAIIHVANLFKHNIRITDVVARYGGEEFLIFLPKANSLKANEIAEKICEKLAKTPFIVNDVTITLTASFGVCEVNDIMSFDEAIKLADKNLYQAKESGKNKVIG